MKTSSIKLINALVFFLVIWATQCLVDAEKSVSFEQHVQVQQELSQLIANYIKENLPEMTNFKMHSIYTKPPRKDLLEAFFNYSFTAAVNQGTQLATTELSGVAVLRKIKDGPQQEWALEKISIDGETLTFTEPVVITAQKDALPQEEAPAAPAEKKEEPAKPEAVKPAPVKPATPKVEKSPVVPTEPSAAPTTEAPAEAHQ